MTSLKGSFKSPGFPNNYTDGQLCSWKISAPSNHTIQVIFTNFAFETLKSNDSLEYYIKHNESYNLADRFHGDKMPPVVIASSDIMFVMRTDMEFTGRGFYAEYKISPSEGRCVDSEIMDRWQNE